MAAASSGAGSSSAAAADSSSVRTIEAKDVLDESTHPLVLRVVRDGDGLCDLTLCDGSTTWQGTVDEVSLTPPKMGFSREDFASRLLAGLQGADGSDDTDTFKLEKLPEERRLLIWSAVCRPGTLPVTLQQRMTLLPERSARPGAGLMALLLQLAVESTALQCECRSETERARTLEVRRTAPFARTDLAARRARRCRHRQPAVRPCAPSGPPTKKWRDARPAGQSLPPFCTFCTPTAARPLRDGRRWRRRSWRRWRGGWAARPSGCAPSSRRTASACSTRPRRSSCRPASPPPSHRLYAGRLAPPKPCPAAPETWLRCRWR